MPALTNQRHELFAQALAKGRSADAAYTDAGYKHHESNPARLSGNERVRERVAELQAIGASRAEVTIEMVVRELAKIGFSDLRKVVRWTGNSPKMDLEAAEETGKVEISVTNFVSLFDSDEIDDSTAAAISEISQTKEGALKVKLYDKRAALVDIGKYLGMFKERVEVDAKHAHTFEQASIPEVLGWLEAASGAGEKRPH